MIAPEQTCSGVALQITGGLNSPSPIEDEDENEVLSDGSGIRSERDDRVPRPDSYEGGNRIVETESFVNGAELPAVSFTVEAKVRAA
jgi:hypothetical protein